MTRARDFADLAGAASSGNISGKNMVVNGAMEVAQRGTSAATKTNITYHTVDRFKIGPNNMGTFTHTQESDGPAGFTKSVKLECTTADASPAANDSITIQNIIEAQDLQHINKGSSDAKSVTLSFYVKSNKTGTYTAELFEDDNSRHISKTFSVSSSGTWEYKAITFEGDTSGVMNNDNGVGFYVLWHLGAGSNFTSGTLGTSWQANDTADRVSSSNVNLADTIGNYFQLTGVQLEVGEKATEFEHRSYADEYLRCIRYAYVPGKYGAGGTGSGFLSEIVFPVQMRATPACTNVFSAGYDNTNAFGNSPEANEFSISNILSGNGVSWSSAPTSIAQTEQTVDRSFVYPNGGSTPGESTDQNIYVFKFGTGAYIIFDAEL